MNDIRLNFEHCYKSFNIEFSPQQLNSLLLWSDKYECYENNDIDKAYFWYSKGFTSGERD